VFLDTNIVGTFTLLQASRAYLARKGVAETVQWYLDRRDWWEPLRKGVYPGQRLGLNA
jgi:dTDP-D-glucose 4,6-dehydratase